MAKGVGGPYWTIPGVVASGSLASSQYKIVKFASTAGAVKVGSAATDNAIGVLMNDPADGENANVACLGIVRCLAEASVTQGDDVACSTTGRAKTTTTEGDNTLGKALESSAAAGDYITVLVAPSITLAAAG